MAAREARGSEDTLRSKLLRALQRSPYEPYTGSSGYTPPSEPDRKGPAYTKKAASDLVGVTDGEIDYWDSLGLVRPSRPIGGQLLYSTRDLVELRLVKALVEEGVKLAQVRPALNNLRTWTDKQFYTAELRVAGDGVLIDEDAADKIVDLEHGRRVADRTPVKLASLFKEVDHQVGKFED